MEDAQFCRLVWNVGVKNFRIYLSRFTYDESDIIDVSLSSTNVVH